MVFGVWRLALGLSDIESFFTHSLHIVMEKGSLSWSFTGSFHVLTALCT